MLRDFSVPDKSYFLSYGWFFMTHYTYSSVKFRRYIDLLDLDVYDDYVRCIPLHAKLQEDLVINFKQSIN